MQLANYPNTKFTTYNSQNVCVNTNRSVCCISNEK